MIRWLPPEDPQMRLERLTKTKLSLGPGADDNCSGVAGVLEVARRLSGLRLKKSVRFVFYDMEEIGMVGSRYHVALLGDKEDDIFRGCLCF